MKVISFFIIFLSSWSLIAQEIPPVIWDQVEAYIEGQEEDVDLTIMLDRLEIAYNSNLDINKVEYDELQELRLLSDIQINELIQHRNEYGDFLLVEELQSIESFTIADINRIRGFIRVADEDKLPISIGRMFAASKQDLYLKWGQTLEEKKGFKFTDEKAANYIGDRNKLLIRHRGNYENKLRYGFIIEKDEGEQLFSDTIYKGLDYVTAHVYLKDYSTLLKDVVIGDYSVSMGQGLIAHNGFGAGKSPWVTNIKRGGRALRPYSSVTENGFFRGAAATLRFRKNVELTLFGSRSAQDGNLKLDTLNNETPDLFFSSLLTSGTHRTLSEKEDRDLATVTSYGGIVKYKAKQFHLALNHLTNELADPLIRADRAYNLYRFRGDKLTNTSIDYSYRLKNLNLFGESAYSSTGGLAHLAGALVGLDRRLSLGVLYRNYARDYNALAPRAFGESSLVNNESGLYVGIELNINRHWKIRTYADVWKNPWLKSRVSYPGTGKEYLARVDYFVKRKFSVYAQYFYEEKVDYDRLQTKQKLRLHFANKVSKTLELRNRLEWTHFSNTEGISNGYILYQDVLWKPSESPYSMTARFALFDTDDNDSRVYAYENSILYEFGIPSFAGRGVRYYINLRYKVLRNTTAEFRLARTYKNRGNNGSGNEAIDGDSRTDVKAQLKFSF